MIYFQSLSKSDLAQLLLPISREHVRPRGMAPGAPGEPLAEPYETKAVKRAGFQAKQIFNWVYQRSVLDWGQMSDLSKELRQWLGENLEIYRLGIRMDQQALDGTHKFLWNLHDSKTIESVIIPAALQEKKNAFGNYPEHSGSTDFEAEDEEDEKPAPSRRHQDERALMREGKRFSGRQTEASVDSGQWSRLTACISSQVGCAMACKFCLTGVQGLDRHLQAHEIVTQVHELRMRAPITNIVFMGMGEPLHNLENVIKACEILIDQDGLGFSRRKVTVSTSGIVPAIEELGRRVPVSLAISLNATTDETRSRIMPVNKKWNLATLLKACREFPLGKHRRITFEYVLLQGVNDTLEDAARIVKLTAGIPSKVNLIPFNEHPASEFKRPADEVVKAFQRHLVERNVTATVRISRGRDILAACGQLRSIFGTARGTEKHKDWKPAAQA
jgi:23S rRNA (adenine(2503)-C(2))-methyltransferase